MGSTPWARFLTEQAALLLEEALLYERGILEACAGAPGMEKLTGSYLPFFEAEQARLRQLLELARAGDYEGLGGALAGFGFAPLPRVNTSRILRRIGLPPSPSWKHWCARWRPLTTGIMPSSWSGRCWNSAILNTCPFAFYGTEKRGSAPSWPAG